MNLRTNNKIITKYNIKANYLKITRFSCNTNVVKYLLVALGLTSASMATFAESTTEKIPFAPKSLILGTYSADPQNDETFTRLKKAGFNYVHTYRSDTVEQSVKFLGLARKYDMKVMFDLRTAWNVKHSGDQWLAVTMQHFQLFSGHPAIGMWYLWDEPSTEMLPKVAKLREEMGKAAKAPTTVLINWRTKWENTRGHSDIWMVDSYPIRGENFPNAPLQHYTAFLSGAARIKLPGTPLIPVLQACDFTCFPDQATKLEDKSKLRYPNLVEMRFMAFSSLSYGIHGLFFYSYYHSHLRRTKGQTFFYEVLTPLLAEVKAFDAAVGHPWDVKQDSALNKRENINLGYWAREEGNYMVMTNNSPLVRNLKINLTLENGFPINGKLIPWGENTKTDAILNEGVLSIDDVQPWATFIWQVR